MHRLPVEHQQALDQLPRFYWWHRHRIAAVQTLTARYGAPVSGRPLRYLDVGGGTGATTQEVAKAISKNSGTGIVVHCVEGDTTLAPLQAGKAIQFHAVDLNQDWDLIEKNFDRVTLLDVLEHVDEPVELLRRIRRHLAPEGLCVVTVPAFNFLFSEWDRILGHKQRYTTGSLRKQAEAAGFEVVWQSYLFAYVFPVAVLQRFLFPPKPGGTAEFPAIPAVINVILKILGGIERILFPLRMPFGTSVIAVLQPARTR